MNRIPTDEVIWRSFSSSDENGRLFEWQGHLYRGVTSKAAPLYCRLLNQGVIDRLVDKGLLIDTEVVPLVLDGYDFVVRHRRLPFVSYPYEWSPQMLKDAALLVLDLSLELAQSGLVTQDAHPWNVLFDSYKPVFVDLGSIIKSPPDHPWPGCEEFHRFFVRPLHMYSMGESKVTRWLLHDYNNGVHESDLARLTRFRTARASDILRAMGIVLTSATRKISAAATKRLPRLLKRPLRHARDRLGEEKRAMRRRVPSFEHLRREVESIIIPTAETDWSGYYDACFPTLTPSDDWTPKQQNVHRVLMELSPESTLDIGSNRGWYSQLAARNGSGVVAFDRDQVCIDLLYKDAKTAGLPILPLVVDFTNPSPGYGLCNRWLLPVVERTRCDMVLALALVHHLVFRSRLDFEQIAGALDAFAKRWLLVEFIPRDDRWVSEWYSEKFSWYTLENFVAALHKHFRIIGLMDSYPPPRRLVLCEKLLTKSIGLDASCQE